MYYSKLQFAGILIHVVLHLRSIKSEQGRKHLGNTHTIKQTNKYSPQAKREGTKEGTHTTLHIDYQDLAKTCATVILCDT